MAEDRGSIGVGPDAPLGSPRLEAALVSRDVVAIGRALRHDFVIVPHVAAEGGSIEVRVLPKDETSLVDVAVFSSIGAFSRSFGDDASARFALYASGQFRAFLELNRPAIAAVVFDPADPHGMTATVDDVVAALEDREDDDVVAWVTASPGDADGPHPAGLHLATDAGWHALPTTGRLGRLLLARRARTLVEGVLAEGGGRAREDAAAARSRIGWLAEQARASPGGDAALTVTLGLLADRPVVVTVRLEDLGEPVASVPHLVRAAERIRQHLGPAETIDHLRTALGPTVRAVRIRDGVETLAVDYRLAFPDGRGIARVEFTTPVGGGFEHLDALRDRLVPALDAVIAASSWR